MFVFSLVSEPTLEPTHSTLLFVPGVLYLGVKRQEFEAEHSHPSSSKVKNG
jgi:hypothetical protein